MNTSRTKSPGVVASGQPSTPTQFEAPYLGSRRMPRWNSAELIEPPRFTWRNWAAMLGPGLVMGGAAIGGGEWLLGPEVSAKYGGALMWLATLSILGQLVYNIEISRYALYTGEPIFTGKFRLLPGPFFWLGMYLLLDFGAVFPYLAANAATPVAAVILGQVPDAEHVASHRHLLLGLGYAIFALGMLPLFVGGKIYNSIRVVMSAKIVIVFAFLGVLAVFYSNASTWGEIFSGFVKFGNVPIRRDEDANRNGRLDPGEDWDGDGRLDRVEERLPPTIDSDGDGKFETWADVNGDGRPDKFRDADGDGICDGDNVANVFLSLFQGRGLPHVDLTLMASLAAFVAIAGQGGLSNTPISNYTRDQGWGMGYHVGAIPSLIGGHHIKLSHVGSVFQVTSESLQRWHGWYRHVMRDQIVVWAPACFLGLALPSMLSVEFLQRGTEASQWTAASMTAGGVQKRVAELHGADVGQLFWFMTLFCGFLVLAPSVTSTADGLVRRWVDVFWTGSARLRALEPRAIKRVYFTVLAAYMAFGFVMLGLNRPQTLVLIAGVMNNIALGFSCWHTLGVNLVLLPRPLRPGWFVRASLFFAGFFFWIISAIAIADTARKLGLV